MSDTKFKISGEFTTQSDLSKFLIETLLNLNSFDNLEIGKDEDGNVYAKGLTEPKDYYEDWHKTNIEL